MTGCIFCEVVAGRTPTEIVSQSGAAVIFEPLDPVTEGHVLVVPRQHARYLWDLDSRALMATVIDVALATRQQPCNVIQSNGLEATQTIEHVHFHVVPRRSGDELKLPWTDQFNRGPGR